MASGDTSQLDQLLERARSGDASARDALFQRCRAYVGFLAKSHVDSWLMPKVDSSDLIQQTLLEAYEAFPKFTGNTEGEWLAWLKRILRNNATDFVRRFGAAKRRAALEVAIGGGQSSYFRPGPILVDQGESPSSIVSRREQEIEVANALEQLPEEYQQVIILRSLQRLPFNEVAEQMNRSRPATQMLWMRAVRKLTELLGEQ
ncbi:sigma-70 family RNA polymerase sigma factor [bacterium]|nr:sigma-70 family RNA polymerase sigma factor [bacterium]